MTAKQDLVGEVVRLIVELQDATQSVDEAAADYLDVNLTDLGCLRLVVEQGPTTAGALADATGLTRAAITFVIDRLEHAGLAVRVADPTDRRRTLVMPTDTALLSITSLWSPIEEEGMEILSRYTKDELTFLAGFLDEATKLQHEHSHRIRDARRRNVAG